MAQRLRHTFSTATVEQVAVGREWYPNALEVCEDIAAEYGHGLVPVVNALAALSPQQGWGPNVKMVRRLVTFDRFRNPGTYHRQALLAWECLTASAPITGRKCVAFAGAILGGVECVVIDRHMITACGHHRDGMSARQYRILASAVTLASRNTNESPRDYQAIIWGIISRGERFNPWD